MHAVLSHITVLCHRTCNHAGLKKSQNCDATTQNPKLHSASSMDFALSFGSLGDIIQLCQLAIQLGRAVGVGTAAVNGSSAKEYQQLRHDLDLFVGVLMQASRFYLQLLSLLQYF